jgi:hypothetical protein
VRCVDRTILGSSGGRYVRWVVILSAGLASAGLMVVSATMNFSFGSSFGRTALKSYAYGAAFGFADILKAAAPIAAAGTFAKRKWGAACIVGVGNLHGLLCGVCRWLCFSQSNLHGGQPKGSSGPEPKPTGKPGG